MKHILITAFAAVLLVGCGESPKEISIHDAAVAGDIEAVKQHLAAGADVNAKSERGGWTPLHAAAKGGRKEVVELLIAAGADVNAKTDDGWTPLHWAVVAALDSGDKEVVELLIAKGADVNAKMEDRWTPLDEAIAVNRTETADLLRKHGAKTGEELKAESK
jgi:ankyrin repeat protein